MSLPVGRPRLKVWLFVIVSVVFILLIVWDHSFQASGWVPSLGANLITMLATVVVLDSLFRRRQEHGAAVILRSAIMSIADVIASSAQGYQARPDLAEAWFTPQIESWKRALEALQRDLNYAGSDLGQVDGDRIRKLDGNSRMFAHDMAWQNFAQQTVITSLALNQTWLILREIGGSMYRGDDSFRGICDEIERADIEPMRKRFGGRW